MRTHALMRAHAVALMLLGMYALASPSHLEAQTLVVAAGDSTRLSATPGSRVRVPIRLDIPSAAGTDVASLNAVLLWDPARLTLDSVRADASTGFTITANTAAAGTGTASFTLTRATGITSSAPLAAAFFTAGAAVGGTTVRLSPTDAATAAGTSLLSRLRSRGLGVCVAPSGLWGDVNDDGAVNIIDAQQIARFSVGLSVANLTALTARADVTADDNRNIIDAQQIARFTVGLSAAARIRTPLFTAAPAASIQADVSGPTTLAPGTAAQINAIPLDAGGVSLAGCVPVTYSSSQPSVATVSSQGLVTAVAVGTASISAGAGTASAPIAVTVAPPYTLVVATPPASGVSNEILQVQPVVEVRDGANALVTSPITVTATVASGPGTLSGTTVVSTVNGRAPFTNLAITGDGEHRLRFSAEGLPAIEAPSMAIARPASMRLLVGDIPTRTAAAGEDVTIPLILDMSGRGANNLAAIVTTITWDPAKFTFVAHGAGTWVDDGGEVASVTVNATDVARGVLIIGGFTSGATTATRILRTLTLRPALAGAVVVGATVDEAGDDLGRTISVAPRSLGGAAATASPNYRR
jgi:hypothetical protein